MGSLILAQLNLRDGESVSRQFGFVSLFRCIRLKQFHSSIKTDTLSWLGGLDVTHQTEVPMVKGLNLCSDKILY